MDPIVRIVEKVYQEYLMHKREMSVAGSFYPDNCSEIQKYLAEFNSSYKNKQIKQKVKAVISPHAGYIYSGFSANAAFNRIDTSSIKRVIVIGPGHRVYIKGASTALYDSYSTPCGDITIDLEYSKKLIEKYKSLSFMPEAHQEHSTETQVPFIQHYCKNIKLVEIVYGNTDYTELIPIIKDIFSEEENLLVISTDLSHFHTLKKANLLDNNCLEAVKTLDISRLETGCEACGIIGLKAVLQSAKELGLKSELIDYRTSYDASGDAERVVGYMSAVIT